MDDEVIDAAGSHEGFNAHAENWTNGSLGGVGYWQSGSNRSITSVFPCMNGPEEQSVNFSEDNPTRWHSIPLQPSGC